MYFMRLTTNKLANGYKKVRFISSKVCKCQVEELKDRGILKVSGPDSPIFLQGLITNDIKLLDTQKCIYTMFLNIKGRVLYDALIYKGLENEFLLECDIKCLNDLSKHIKMYKLKKNVDLNPDLETKVKVVFGSVDKIENVMQDPRHKDLGYRYLSNSSIPCTPIEGVYKEIRYKLGIAEGESEIAKGEMFPLEMNLDYLGGVSFSKGCYLGQEITSRTKHTGVVRKRLMPLELSNPIDPDLTIVQKNEGQREIVIGKIKSVYRTLGLGLIRLAEINSQAITNAGIQVKIPSWWPEQGAKI